MGTSAAWTPERRAKQAEAIRNWQPWNKSTGPRTKEGKARSSRNADKGIAEFDARILEVQLGVRSARLAKAETSLQRLGLGHRSHEGQ
jgi:hypothetical protein